MMTDWAIPQQAKLKYTQLFNLHDRSRSGFLSGVQCRDILMQSGLPRNTLAEIWNLSDIDGDGQLTREEFILAMHLTNQVRAGQTLPLQLPPDLVPPSYRRQRSISATSVHSSTSIGSSISGGVAAPLAVNDDPTSHRSAETVISPVGQASILNSNSFEDKRRENFEKGRAELERRRLKIIEQQTIILSEQLVQSKKQVAEAKSKIDAMRSERDSKAGLLTSLEAQLKTVRDRKAFLDQEEVQIIAIAKDLNLINSVHSSDLDQQTTQAKQESISKMKENLNTLLSEKDDAVRRSTEAQARLEELKKEFRKVSEEASKEYSNYKDQIAQAKALKQQFIEESKSKLVDLDSAWDSASPNINSSFKQQPSPADKQAEPTDSFAAAAAEDPWATSSKQFMADPFAESNNNVSSPACDTLNSPSLALSPRFDDQSASFGGGDASSDLTGLPSSVAGQSLRKKMYKAVYAFEARNVDELTINPGDIIIGSDEVCEPGWLSGKIDDRSGLFPEAYVEPLPGSVTSPVSNDGFRGAANTIPASSLATNISSQQYDPSIGSQAASSSVPSVVKYKVVYAFEARNVDELNMSPGDIITGVEGPHEPGWMMGELNGQRGLFPEAYVEKLAETQLEQTTAATEQMGVSWFESLLM